MQQTTIFGKPLDDVTFEDVKDFCNKQVKEGINLDYKRDLSSKSLVKTIAAFANTRGGFIIVGVDDVDDKPKLPVEGMAWKESLSLTVTSTIIDTMYPYLSVQVKVCDPIDGKTFIIIQVPESHEAPHWLFNKSQLYIRRADRSDSGDWESFAAESEWEFLRNKREKSIALRSDTVSDVQAIFAMEGMTDARRDKSTPWRIDLSGLLRTILVPMFPREIMAETTKLKDYLDQESIPTILDGYTYPSATVATKVFQEGAYRYEADEHGIAQNFNTLTRFGVVASYDRVLRTDIEQLGSHVYFSHALASIEATIRYAGIIYGKIGYEGSILCRVELKAPNSVALLLGDRFNIRTVPRNLRGDFEWNVEATVLEINDPVARTRILYEIMKEMARSFGYAGDTDSVVDDYLNGSAAYPS